MRQSKVKTQRTLLLSLLAKIKCKNTKEQHKAKTCQKVSSMKLQDSAKMILLSLPPEYSAPARSAQVPGPERTTAECAHRRRPQNVKKIL